MPVRLLTSSLLLGCAALVAQAPPGFKTYENKLAPLTFHYPTAYKEVPLPPTEQLLVAKFVLDKTPKELKKVDERLLKQAQLQLHVFQFEDATAPVTGGGEVEDPDKGPSTVREAMEQKSRVSSWAEFEKRIGGFALEAEAKDADAFVLRYRGQSPSPELAILGYLVRKRYGSQVLGAYGYTFAPHHEALKKVVERVVKSMEPNEDDSGEMDAARIDRIYARGDFGAVEWRKKVRQALAKGWKAVDTENYLIVHHTKNAGLVQRVARDIEAMRLFYMELFPPAGEIDRVSVVRICETAEEYRQYGGPPNTGGYWHPGNEELVLFDYSYTMKTMTKEQKEAMNGRRLSSEDSMLVLRHEAFHQYIHYAVGEFSPHDWFNEGYGDYFSGAVVSSNTGRVLRIDPSSWRIHRAKDMCEYGDGFVPLEEILKAERAVFYNKARIANFYAGAWSFVYFLKHADEALRHPVWSKMLETYFVSMKRCYQEELDKFGPAPDLQQKQVAGFEARKRALAATLDGVDLPVLEKAWRQWVVDMRDPWPGDRKKR